MKPVVWLMLSVAAEVAAVVIWIVFV